MANSSSLAEDFDWQEEPPRQTGVWPRTPHKVVVAATRGAIEATYEVHGALVDLGPYRSANTNDKVHENASQASETIAIGDVNGSLKVLVDSMKTLGLIRLNDQKEYDWIGGNQTLIVIGDIIADRGEKIDNEITGKATVFRSLEAMALLRKLGKQAEKAGGKIIEIAGNHEDFAMCGLTGEATADDGNVYEFLNSIPGFIEFLKFFDQFRILHFWAMCKHMARKAEFESVKKGQKINTPKLRIGLEIPF